MDVLSDMINLTNCKIHFSTPEGEFKGIVKMVSPFSKTVVVEDLTFTSKNLYRGTGKFDISEIITFKKICDSNCKGHQFSTDLKKINSPQYSLQKIKSCKKSVSELNNPSFELLTLFDISLPQRLIIVDSFNEIFFFSIQHLEEQDTVNVYLEGPDVSRHGTLVWACFSTSTHILFFDIQNLKKKAFDEGLKHIFENVKIEKIFHNCRRASDCLYHKYDTTIMNVFDTHVANLFIRLQDSKESESNIQDSLNYCLQTYLNIPLDSGKTIAQMSDSNKIGSFQKRPLLKELQDELVRQVVYLRALKEELSAAMLRPYKKAVQIYLQSFQKTTDVEVSLNCSSTEYLSHLKSAGLMVVSFQNLASESPIESEINQSNILSKDISFRENQSKEIGLSEQSLGYSISDNLADSLLTEIQNKCIKKSSESLNDQLAKPSSTTVSQQNFNTELSDSKNKVASSRTGFYSSEKKCDELNERKSSQTHECRSEGGSSKIIHSGAVNNTKQALSQTIFSEKSFMNEKSMSMERKNTDRKSFDFPSINRSDLYNKNLHHEYKRKITKDEKNTPKNIIPKTNCKVSSNKTNSEPSFNEGITKKLPNTKDSSKHDSLQYSQKSAVSKLPCKKIEDSTSNLSSQNSESCKDRPCQETIGLMDKELQISDENEWIQLRAVFAGTYDPDDIKNAKPRFIPA